MDEKNSGTKTAIKESLSVLIMGLSKKAKLIIALILVAVISVGIIVVVAQNEEGQLSTISKSYLQKVVEINELSTVDYPYNATVAKYKEGDKEEVMYYVAYEGTVTAGIDFREIEIKIDKDEKIIYIILPEIEIHGISVDMGKMEYIFVKNKFETETISQEAYKLCKKDLNERAKNERLLYDTARENAISSVEALFKPWIETVDKRYSVEIK